MFMKLSKYTERVLKMLLETENKELLMENAFNSADEQNDALLRGAMKELREGEFVATQWGSGVPTSIILYGKAYTYFEDKKESEAQLNTIGNISINNFNANSSNIVFGNVNNSKLDIDNSVHNISKKIHELGGEDTELLLNLLNEVKRYIEIMNKTKSIPQDKGFLDKISEHLSKHGWFYGEMVGLIGTAVIQIMSK